MSLFQTRKILILFFLANFLFFSLTFAQNSEIENIQKLINEKNQELNNLLKQKEILEKELEQVNQKTSQYQQEISKLNNSIKQLNLLIETNKLNIEKLNLEIELLNQEINNHQKKIELKKQTISKIFKEIQEYDNENLLLFMFKNKSLSQNFNDLKNLIALNQNLKKESDELLEIKEKLVNNLEDLNYKKELQKKETLSYLNRQTILNEQKKINQDFLAQTKNQEKIYKKQLEELEKKQEEIGSIINELEEKLRKQYGQQVPLKKGILDWPLDSIFITQEYGATDFAQRAYRTKFHNGIDLRAPIGTPIYAAFDGKVLRVDNNDQGISFYKRFQYGLYVLIDHQNGISTLYAHLSQALVKANQEVKKGQLIGYSGNTGYSYGPHLHFGVYLTPSLEFKKIPPANGLVPIGATLNPLDYLKN